MPCFVDGAVMLMYRIIRRTKPGQSDFFKELHSGNKDGHDGNFA